ncbi:MAG: Inositol 2-dehydrogenase [Candidatus Hydrogenedentes bacterium ADurb.Bin170]|nr:MAG: Inositol 2-dehydrogenase [Candidatus Hydrogenedentes bacterium ADurb.Bin170]
MSITRRRFLTQLSVLGAAPFVLPSRIWSAAHKPNDRINIAVIGAGKQGRYLLEAFMNHKRARVVAVCDVDTTRRLDIQRMVNEFYTGHPEAGSPDCAAYNDFRAVINRRDIDAVCVTTPDHWHAYIAIAAMRSGKDVYCEKPLAHNVHEIKEMMKTVALTGRVLQTGSMQRSMKEFRIACELVRNGMIGKISRVECSFGGPAVLCDLPEETLEPGLDWDMWLGPAPLRPYSSVLSPRGIHKHFPDWREYREYGGGMVTDWGAHHMDIAQWGLDMDKSGPVEIIPPDNPEAVDGGILIYDNGIRVIHQKGFGVHFYGSDGEVKVNRGKFEFWLQGKKIAGFAGKGDEGSLGAALSKVEEEFLKDPKIKLYVSVDHVRNFLDCMESRKKPITDVEVGGRSATVCHLLNQAYYHRQVLKWSPRRMQFARGGGDEAWVTREFRSPWVV